MPKHGSIRWRSRPSSIATATNTRPRTTTICRSSAEQAITTKKLETKYVDHLNAHSPLTRQRQSAVSHIALDPRQTWSRTTRWIITTAKQVLPIIAVFAIFAAVVAATIALRLAIWLPLYYRH